MTDTCETCRYWDSGISYGIRLAGAPLWNRKRCGIKPTTIGDNGLPLAAMVDPTDWCGEHKEVE